MKSLVLNKTAIYRPDRSVPEVESSRAFEINKEEIPSFAKNARNILPIVSTSCVNGYEPTAQMLIRNFSTKVFRDLIRSMLLPRPALTSRKNQ